MMMHRKEGWQQRLHETLMLYNKNQTGLVWGKVDCVLLICDCIEAITGEYPLKDKYDVRGKYSTEKGAVKLMKKIFRADDLEGSVTSILGKPSSPSFATVGDVCLIDHEDLVLGICNGSNIACICKEGGIEFIGMNRAINAWKIG